MKVASYSPKQPALKAPAKPITTEGAAPPSAASKPVDTKPMASVPVAVPAQPTVTVPSQSLVNSAPDSPKHPAIKRGPRKPAASRKTMMIGANCTPAEFELIKEAAEASGLKPGPFLVDLATKTTATILRENRLYFDARLEIIMEKLRSLPQIPKGN